LKCGANLSPVCPLCVPCLSPCSYYAKLRQQEMERERELAEKYRDRARERRDGVNKDYEETELISTTANYRAVGPTAEADKSAAEKRRQLIQESKFLGGDMEHTHLVKGLDFALLQKVRAEITSKEKEEEDMMEKVQKETKKDVEPEEKIEFKTRLGRNIYRMAFRSGVQERNELFLPGRMAYVVDLDDEFTDTDIPTTLIRSKADCPSMEAQTTLTTNDIVISKLTQILSYLRQGTRHKKMKKKDKGWTHLQPVGCPVLRSSLKTSGTTSHPPRPNPKTKSATGDETRTARAEDTPTLRNRVETNTRPGSIKDQIKMINEKFGAAANQWQNQEPYPSLLLLKEQLGDFFGGSNSYAECYPATHCPSMPAVPSVAAFQYGIKMSEGRKTRRFKETNEKAELDRQWKKISAIIEKRKKMEADG
uniref:IK cytokine n=1 Tax=Poecilia reticulata TaxID=8081 RepID=A0A3P9N621_POERE